MATPSSLHVVLGATDGSKYAQAFGGTPTPHQEAMHRTVAWYRQQGASPATKQAPEETKR